MAIHQNARLSLETLDERTLPHATVLNLTSQGASAVAEQFIARQSDAGSREDFTQFVRLRDCGVEQGYNTTARHKQFDERRGPNVQSALKLGDVPVVMVDGVAYREFVLNVNQARWSPRLSLDQVRIYLGETSDLNNYKAGKLGGESPVFDLDANGNVSIVLNDNLNRGYGDMTLLVRDSAFAGADADTFVYLYSKFGQQRGAWSNGGAESWSVRKELPPPPPSGGSSLSGRVFVDAFQNNIFDPQNEGDVPLEAVEITLSRLNEAEEWVAFKTTTTDADGFYSFDGLAAGTYQITQTQPTSFEGQELVDSTDFVGSLSGDDTLNDVFSGIVVGNNQQGVNYNFTEVIR